MTLQDLIEQRPAKISVQEAAAIMGVTPRYLQLALQQGKFPFGTAVKMTRWSYYINTERFIQYMTGGDAQWLEKYQNHSSSMSAPADIPA